MIYGKVTTFSQFETPKSLAVGLNESFSFLNNAINDLAKKMENVSTGVSTGDGITGYTHSQAMPDPHGLNKDHDKRYYPKSHDINLKHICIATEESDTFLSVGDGTIPFLVPNALHKYVIVDAIAGVTTKGVTGTTDVQLRRSRAGTDNDILSTKITIGDEYYARDGAIDSDYRTLNVGDQVFVDVDAIHSGTAPKGLFVTITVRKL
jgi:hypothetical protein